jgi:multicomponent Na+:H+ antiporter subunit D
MLAFLVISGIGVMLMGVALGGTTALAGTVFYAVHSMIAMTAVFLLAGMMHRRSGTADLAKSGGLYEASPALAGVALVLVFTVAGLPPFSGLWPKIMLVKGGLDAGAFWLVGALLLSAFITTMALGRMFLLAFWRPAATPIPNILSGRGELSSKIALLGLLIPLVAFGVYPEPLVDVSIRAADWLLNPAPYIEAVFPAEVKAP